MNIASWQEIQSQTSDAAWNAKIYQAKYRIHKNQFSSKFKTFTENIANDIKASNPKLYSRGKALAKFHNFAMGGGLLGNVIGIGFLGYGAYEGYKSNGIVGAAGSIAENYMWGAGVNTALKATGMLFGSAGLAGSALVGGGLGVAGILGYSALESAAAKKGSSVMAQAFSERVREHTRKRARLEMGSPVQDQYGNAATMRQRSIMAMRTSKINARGALGMEANSRFQSY